MDSQDVKFHRGNRSKYTLQATQQTQCLTIRFKLIQGTALGKHEYYLPLARFNSGNRLIHFFRNPSQLIGNPIVEKLKANGAFAKASIPATSASSSDSAHVQQPGEHKMALNMATRWNTDAAGSIVALPVVLSLLFAIIWPVIAVKVYKADVNASVQTSFGIASYVVTSGALLIALVAFLDAQNEKIKF